MEWNVLCQLQMALHTPRGYEGSFRSHFGMKILKENLLPYGQNAGAHSLGLHMDHWQFRFSQPKCIVIRGPAHRLLIQAAYTPALLGNTLVEGRQQITGDL